MQLTPITLTLLALLLGTTAAWAVPLGTLDHLKSTTASTTASTVVDSDHVAADTYKWVSVLADSSGEAIVLAESRHSGWSATDVRKPSKGSRSWRIKLRRAK